MSDFAPDDQTATLFHVREIPAYNDWVHATFAPFVRGTVLEVGCGIGTYTARLRSQARRLLCVDIRFPYAATVARTYRGDPDVACLVGALGSSFELALHSVDTIVCLNVLEHVVDDFGALRAFHRWLRPGGALVVQVPAHRWLLGTIDRALGHHRRYTRRSLAELLAAAGFRIELPPRLLFALGIPGWWWHNRVLRSSRVPAASTRIANFLARLSRVLEAPLPMPVGLTMVAVAVTDVPADPPPPVDHRSGPGSAGDRRPDHAGAHVRAPHRTSAGVSDGATSARNPGRGMAASRATLGW